MLSPALVGRPWRGLETGEGTAFVVEVEKALAEGRSSRPLQKVGGRGSTATRTPSSSRWTGVTCHATSVLSSIEILRKCGGREGLRSKRIYIEGRREKREGRGRRRLHPRNSPLEVDGIQSGDGRARLGFAPWPIFLRQIGPAGGRRPDPWLPRRADPVHLVSADAEAGSLMHW